MAPANPHQSSSDLALPLAQTCGFWRGAIALVTTWHSRAKQRRELLELEPWAMRDLGLSKTQVVEEAAKPFWRP
ncbi:MAG: DUF1127 domain-containing protein [Alphaproteobacteria bacterium]